MTFQLSNFALNSSILLSSNWPREYKGGGMVVDPVIHSHLQAALMTTFLGLM